MGLSSLLVGFLAAFLTWAILWSLADRVEGRFGLEGEVSVLTFVADDTDAAAGPNPKSTVRLREFLSARALTLMVASIGDGAPQLTVYNPGSRVSWLPSAPTPGGPGTKAAGYLFRGTYSFERWTAARARPLVPAEVEILGTVERPPGVDRLQFAVVEPAGRLPSGDYLVSTGSRSDLDELTAVASAAGLALQTSRSVTTGDLLRDPLVVLSLVMLVTGVAGVVTSWSIALTGLALESGIRSQSGGSVAALVRHYLRRYSVGPLIGVPVGCLLSLVVVRAASGLWPDGPEALAVVRAAVVATVAAVAALGLVLLVLVRRQVRVE